MPAAATISGANPLNVSQGLKKGEEGEKDEVGGLWFFGSKNFTLGAAQVGTSGTTNVYAMGSGTLFINAQKGFGYGYYNDVNKYGSGTVVVHEDSNNSEFTALFTVHQGTLQIDGTMKAGDAGRAPGSILVDTGATLSGKGYIEPAKFNVNGTFNPNDMTVKAYWMDLRWEPYIAWDIKTAVPINMKTDSTFMVDFKLGGTALTLLDCDQEVGVSGLSLLDGPVTLHLNDLEEGSMTLVDYAGGNSILGEFANITTDVFGNFGNGVETISNVFEYTNGSGGIIEINYATGLMTVSGELTPIPEPTTWALMIGGLGALALLRRRK